MLHVRGCGKVCLVGVVFVPVADFGKLEALIML